MSSSEPPLPVPEDDRLDAAASAVADGVATPDEAALVAASPDGQARVAALRAVAAAVARPVPDQDPAAASRALAAALAAFDAGDAGYAWGGEPAGADGAPAEPSARGGGAGATATVTPLQRPGAGAEPGRWPGRLPLVAAAVAVLVGIGALVGLVRSDDVPTAMMANEDTGRELADARTSLAPATAPPQAADPAMAGGAAGGAAAPGPAGTVLPPTTVRRPPTTAATALLPPVVDGGDIGSQTDLQALAQRAAAALDSAPDPATTGRTALPSDVQACVDAGPAAAGQPVGALRYRAVGTYQATPAVVLAYDRPGTPPRLLLVLSRTGCTLLASTPF